MAVLEAIQRERVTSVLLVPTMINFLVNSPAIGDYDLNSLRRILYGASPMLSRSSGVPRRCLAAR